MIIDTVQYPGPYPEEDEYELELLRFNGEIEIGNVMFRRVWGKIRVFERERVFGTVMKIEISTNAVVFLCEEQGFMRIVTVEIKDWDKIWEVFKGDFGSVTVSWPTH